jgi:hypothetical protein
MVREQVVNHGTKLIGSLWSKKNNLLKASHFLDFTVKNDHNACKSLLIFLLVCMVRLAFFFFNIVM